MFDHQAFSKAMKLALADYLETGERDQDFGDAWLQALSLFSAKHLEDGGEKIAFWVNVYNGLTNYQIVHHQLQKSVWELPGFFADRSFRIGELDWSLDDIEHGILRKNGPRKKDKPRAFQEGDARMELMVTQFDPRIHFALNCGSVSCPPLAFYSADNLEAELTLAEKNFAAQEFKVDGENKIIHCSEIFIWYRSDFPDSYLNDPQLVGYQIREIPYQWTIH